MNENNPVGEVVRKSSKKIWYIVGGIVLVLIIGRYVFIGGSERAVENALEKATGENVDVNLGPDGTATYTTSEGTMTYGTNSLPDNWPSDAPVYPGGTIQFSGSSNPQTGEAGAAVAFQTSDSAAKVTDFYKKQLVKDGWTIEGTFAVGGATTLSAKKGNRTIGVYIAESAGMTQVTVGLGQ